MTVESWRVVAQAVVGAKPTADATLRLKVDNHRILATGEGSNSAAALRKALDSAEEMLPGSIVDLGTRGERISQRVLAKANVLVTAMHQDALLGRLAVLLNTHQVTNFSYRVDPTLTVASVHVMVRGGEWQVNRVANRLRRVIGVIEVTVRSPDDWEETPSSR